MNLLLFSTAFILQYMGHRLGDYMFQSNKQAIGKADNENLRCGHATIYSAIIGLLMLFVFPWQIALWVAVFTWFEHMWIDSREPVIAWKLFFERVIARDKTFTIDKLPLFVIVEIDQTIHILRIFIISLLIGFGYLTVG